MELHHVSYRRGSQSTIHPETEDKEGYVYYVRLNTPLGFLYKLGFTSMPSVKERFAFQNKGHENQIDFQYPFMKSKNALSIEQTLHAHFEHKAAFPIPEDGMPFFENGQAELYVEDVLEMDPEYTQEQADRVEAAIFEARMRRIGKAEAAIQEALQQWRKQRTDSNELSAGIAKFAVSWPVSWIIWCWTKIRDRLFTAPRAAERTVHIANLKGDLQAHKRQYMRRG